MPWNKNAALAFIPFVMFGLVFGIGYVGISMVHDSSNGNSTTTASYNPPFALNYSAYQITGTSAAIVLLYSFSPTNGVGVINMSQIDYGPDYLDIGTFTSCLIPSTNCSALQILPSVSQLDYGPDSNYTITFTIDVTQGETLPSPYFLFFPPSAPCGYYLFLIFGNQVPSRVPNLIFTCFALPGNYPKPDVSVIGIQNITGLNIPG